ncbi:MAG: rhodanese-like domain-containing protein [Alphaproteobacteria bacterium]
MAAAFMVAVAPAAVTAAEPLVVDIRTPAEWRATGVVEEALLLTFFAADGSSDAARFVDRLAAEVGRDAPVLLLCRTGNRTRAVLSVLERAGFRRVAHVEGGLTRWRAEGRDVVTPAPDTLPRTTRFDRIWRCSAEGDERASACAPVR